MGAISSDTKFRSGRCEENKFNFDGDTILSSR